MGKASRAPGRASKSYSVRLPRIVAAGALVVLAAILVMYVAIPVATGPVKFDPSWAGTAAEYITALVAGVALVGVWIQVDQHQKQDAAQHQREANSIDLTVELEPWLRDSVSPGTAVSIFATNVGDARVSQLEVTVRDIRGASAPESMYMFRRRAMSVAPDVDAKVYILTLHVPADRESSWITSDASVHTRAVWVNVTGAPLAMSDNGATEL